MRYVICVAIVLVCTTSRAQSPAIRPQFEVASVRPTAKDETSDVRLSQLMREVRRNRLKPDAISMTGNDRVRLKDWPLLDLIAAAYNVRATQISGPDWLSDQGFDIEATVPDGTPPAELNAMLQSLLEDRFGLKAHRVTKTGKGFALTVAKDGPRLTLAAPPVSVEGLSKEKQEAQLQQNAEANMAAMAKRMRKTTEDGTPPASVNSVGWRSITTGELAAQLVRFTEAPVIDETGLTGKYSVTLETSKNADGSGTSVFDAVDKLGLKLEPRKVTAEVVIVDQVSKSPTPN
jgi:uncharacterized protein (TIGR03435 family)